MPTENNTILIVYLSVAIFIGLLLIYFLVTLFFKEKRYRILQKQKLNAEVIAAELERNNIATQLHNDIGPFLSSVKMRLELIQTENEDQLNECKKVIDQCVLQIRSIARELAPLNDIEISLANAVKQYIHHINVKDQLDIQFVMNDEISMTNEQTNVLYRILQEIIQNTIKHAKASLFKIEVSKENDEILVRTSDNGIGYDMKKIKEHNKLGLGLLGIMTRVELLKGSMSQSPEIHLGTKYNIRIPLMADEKR